MHDSQFSWLPFGSLGGTAVDIKEEPSDPSYSILSPPTTPSLHPSATNFLHSTSCRRRSSISLVGTERVRPYPSPKRGTPSRTEESGIMPATPTCATWPPTGTRSGSNRSHPPPQRGPSDTDDGSYPLRHQYMPNSFAGHITTASELRPASSSSSLTSSLTGAMGDTSISPHARQSRSPSSPGNTLYDADTSQDSTWRHSSQLHSQQLSIAMQNSSYPGVAGFGNVTFQHIGSGANDVQYRDYSSTMDRNASPDSLPSGSPAYGQALYNDQYTLQARGQPPLHSRSTGSNYTANYIAPSSFHRSSESSASAEGRLEAEVQYLRKRVRDREVECARARAAIEAMRGGCYDELPTPAAAVSQSPSFQASWKARTEARKRAFCSLNRAGNALCAWHDSRRERREFPPRNAPPGYLNCGCTHEEALFEESLARHSVGSYHPGESVRMDPALRNPLLKLLQQRYGYQDGDFERDPNTGNWTEGEGPAYWEQQAHSGASSRRRVESDRH